LQGYRKGREDAVANLDAEIAQAAAVAYAAQAGKEEEARAAGTAAALQELTRAQYRCVWVLITLGIKRATPAVPTPPLCIASRHTRPHPRSCA